MSGGVPPSSRARSRRKISASSEVQKAARLYERFSGHEAESLGKIKVKPLPKVGICVGEIDGVLYTTVRDGVVEKYIHKFKASDKPLFVVSPDGKGIWFVGGRYDFTERGIVDKSDTKNRRR
jgi:hypothetical protein